MSHPVVALVGKKRSGKDTLANRLVTAHGFTRVAFADPLKAAALEVNPIAHYYRGSREFLCLAEAVDELGWEAVKDVYPEARGFLQRLGVTMRAVDADIWCRPGLAAAREARLAGPVVVTDVRFPNELDGLLALGATSVRIIRPSAEDGDTHESETALDDRLTDIVIHNTSSVAAMRDHADRIAWGA